MFKKLISLMLITGMVLSMGSFLVFAFDTPVISSATALKYDSSYKITTVDITDVITDGELTNNTSSLSYYSKSKVTDLGLDAQENAGQYWLIELDKFYSLGYIELVYNYTNKWVDFNVQVSEDNAVWEDLGTIRPEMTEDTVAPVKLPLKGAYGKYIKIKVLQRNGTNAASTETTAWGANLGAGCAVALYEVVSVGIAPQIKAATVMKYNASYEYGPIDIKAAITDKSNTNNDSAIAYQSSSKVTSLGLDSAKNANQYWLIEFDRLYEFESISVVYNYTDKWVDFNVQVSKNNTDWTDLGTIRPEVAVTRGDPVTIPLDSTEGKFIKLRVIQRNGTNSSSTETTAWGANKGAGCSIGLYEVTSVLAVPKEEAIEIPETITCHSKAYSSKETVTLSDGSTYTGLMGVVFARANETCEDYSRIEYGALITDKKMTPEEMKTDEEVIWAKGEKINSESQYGIRFYGSGLKEAVTYYTLPYAIYKNEAGDFKKEFANAVIPFTPIDTESGNIVFFESFEEGLTSWTLAIKEQTSITVEDSTASAGNKCVFVSDNTNTTSPVAKSPYIEATPGTGYSVTADIKNVTNNSIKVWYKFFDESNNQLYSETLGLSGTDWYTNTEVVIAPEGTKKLQIWLTGTSTALSSAYIDNIIVRKLSEEETKNYIPKTLSAPEVISGIPAEDENFHIYLCIGQSNMVGYAELHNDDILVIDNTYLYNGEGSWEKAQPYTYPGAGEEYLGLNRYSTVAPGTGKMGPSIGFARGMTLNLPETTKIGIISNAMGGTTIEQWSKGFVETEDRIDPDLYESAVARTKEALAKGGVLKGILWLQGESCAHKEGYMDKLVKVADGIREDIGVEKSEVPFIIGEIPPIRQAGIEVIRTAPSYIENCYVVSSEGLRVFDSLHFDYISQRKMGLRFAEKALSEIYGIDATAEAMYEEIYE